MLLIGIGQNNQIQRNFARFQMFTHEMDFNRSTKSLQFEIMQSETSPLNVMQISVEAAFYLLNQVILKPIHIK